MTLKRRMVPQMRCTGVMMMIMIIKAVVSSYYFLSIVRMADRPLNAHMMNFSSSLFHVLRCDGSFRVVFRCHSILFVSSSHSNSLNFSNRLEHHMQHKIVKHSRTSAQITRSDNSVKVSTKSFLQMPTYSKVILHWT